MVMEVAEKDKRAAITVTKVAPKNKIRDSKHESQVIEWLTMGKKPNWISNELKTRSFKVSQPTVKAYKDGYFDQEVTKVVKKQLGKRKADIEAAREGLFNREVTLLEYLQEMLKIHEESIKGLKGTAVHNPFTNSILLNHMNQAIQIREKISKIAEDKDLQQAVEIYAVRIASLAIKTFLPNISEVTRKPVLAEWNKELSKIEDDIMKIFR